MPFFYVLCIVYVLHNIVVNKKYNLIDAYQEYEPVKWQ